MVRNACVKATDSRILRHLIVQTGLTDAGCKQLETPQLPEQEPFLTMGLMDRSFTGQQPALAGRGINIISSSLQALEG